MNTDFDLVVIGSGPGGYVAAIRAAQLGLRTLIVEKDAALGGVCTLRGCIPTKALLHTADLYDEARRGSQVGVVVDGIRVDWGAALAAKSAVVAKSAGGVSALMKKNRIEVARGTGRLAGPGRVRISDGGSSREVSTRNVLLATGSEPRTIPGVELDGDRVISSDHALELPELPKTLAVLGGGVVGLEFASLYSRLGARVTVLEALPSLLATADEDIGREMGRAMRKRGVDVRTGVKVERVERAGAHVSTVFRDVEGMEHRLESDRLLVAVGRRPRSEGLGLEELGIKVDRGFVLVDAQQRTSVPTVFAIGDLVPTPQLAHVAMREGVIAAEVMAGLAPKPLDPDRVPSAVYSAPEVAWVGLTEKQARARGLDVRVGRFPFSASGKARVLHETEGFVKVVSDARYDELVGVHLIGPRVTELVAEAGLALELETTGHELATAVHAHPTLSETLAEAAHALGGAALHL